MSIKLIKMVRSAEMAIGGPLTADVHPDEVAGYVAGNFVVAGDESDSAKPAGPMKAEDLITLIMQAASNEDIDALIEGDKRKTVLAAADARKSELSKGEE